MPVYIMTVNFNLMFFQVILAQKILHIFFYKITAESPLVTKKIPKVSFSEIHYVFVLYIITLMQEHSNFYFTYFIWIYF